MATGRFYLVTMGTGTEDITVCLRPTCLTLFLLYIQYTTTTGTHSASQDLPKKTYSSSYVLEHFVQAWILISINTTETRICSPIYFCAFVTPVLASSFLRHSLIQPSSFLSVSLPRFSSFCKPTSSLFLPHHLPLSLFPQLVFVLLTQKACLSLPPVPKLILILANVQTILSYTILLLPISLPTSSSSFILSLFLWGSFLFQKSPLQLGKGMEHREHKDGHCPYPQLLCFAQVRLLQWRSVIARKGELTLTRHMCNA